MARNRLALQPDRMTTHALYDRAAVLANACRYSQGRTPAERDRLIDELLAVIRELRMRGTQLTLV